MCSSGEPVSTGASARPEPIASGFPFFGAGEDPAPTGMEVDTFGEAAAPLPQSQQFSMEATLPSARLPFEMVSDSSVPVVADSEGASVTSGAREPTRAVLQCFAGQAHLAAALLRQGYFAYGVDRVKHKSAMAPVLQMDLSSRSACDSILTWLDQRKVVGVMICLPKRLVESLNTALLLAVVAGCLERDLPFVLEGSPQSSFWRGLEKLSAEQRPPHNISVEWRHWDGLRAGRSLLMSNMPEIRTLIREAPEVLHRASASAPLPAGYPTAFATALAEVFISGLSSRGLSCINPARINKAARVAAMQQPRGVLAEVMPEWKLVVYVLIPRDAGKDPFEGSKRLKQEWKVPEGVRVLPGLPVLPEDSQLLSRTQSGGKLSPQLQQEMTKLDGASVLRVGIPWDPIEFISKAGKLGHPFHQLSKNNKPLEDLIHRLVHKPSAVRAQRKTYITRWSKRAGELEQAEAELKFRLRQGLHVARYGTWVVDPGAKVA